MAFTAAGLGGSFASGIMQGEQSAQQRREGIQREKEKDYLGMYSKLVQSGDWEPVDSAKGVKDGGVLRIGNVGFLQQKKASGPSLKDQKIGWEIENLQSQIGSRGKVAVGTVRDRKVPGPKGETLIVPYEWDGEKWNPQGPGVKEKVTQTLPKVWGDPNDLSKTVLLQPGDPVPKGYQPMAPMGTQMSLDIRQNAVKAATYKDEEDAAKKIFDDNYYAFKYGPLTKDGPPKQAQELAFGAVRDMVAARVTAKYINEGMSEAQAIEMGKVAGKYAEVKWRKQVEESVPEQVKKNPLVDFSNFSGMGKDALEGYPVPSAEQKKKKYPISKKSLLQKK